MEAGGEEKEREEGRGEGAEEGARGGVRGVERTPAGEEGESINSGGSRQRAFELVRVSVANFDNLDFFRWFLAGEEAAEARKEGLSGGVGGRVRTGVEAKVGERDEGGISGDEENENR